MPKTDTRSVYDVELTHELGTRGTQRRTVRLLADDEQDARESVRHYRKNYETVGAVTLAKSLYRVQLVYGTGSGTVSRNLALLADDEQNAREMARLRKREYEEVGSVVLVRAAGDADDDTAGSPDHNRRA